MTIWNNMAKKETTQSDLIFNNKIILRSVYGKVGIKYFIQPCPNPKTGQMPSCIKKVDSHGDMIMSDEERNKLANGEIVLFKEIEMSNSRKRREHLKLL